MSLACMNHETNITNVICLTYVFPLILYIQHNSLMARMHFKPPSHFVHSTKQLLPYAPDSITYQGTNSTNSTRTWLGFQVRVIKDLLTLSVAQLQ